MAEQSPAVSVSHPPEKLLRLVNPGLKFLLGTPLAGSAGKQLMVLSFKGRKSGNPYSIPVSAHDIGGQLYALAGAPWTRNFRGGADAEVLHDGKKTSMHGELIEDAAVVSELQHQVAESYGVKRAQRMMGLGFREPRIPTVDEFKEACEREGICAIKFTPRT
jgi:hypothetical protein